MRSDLLRPASVCLGAIALFGLACEEPAPDDPPPLAPEALPATRPGLPFDRQFPSAADLPPPPSCEPWPYGTSEPALPGSDGPLYAYPGAMLHPTGATVLVPFHAYRWGDSALDVDFDGPVEVSCDPPAAELAIESFAAGEGVVRVVFATEGEHTLTLSDPASTRDGTFVLAAYTPRLPVWEIDVDPLALDAMEADPFADVEAPATLKTPDGSYVGQLRLRGGSSREYRKKSFRFDIEDGTLPNGSGTVVLRAEWRDKTQLRNLLALDLIRAATWLPAPEAAPISLRLNGEGYGAMLHVDRVDGDFLDREGLDRDGHLYEADPPNSHSVPGGNLTPLPDPSHYPIVYQEQEGRGGHLDLRDLIETELLASGEEGAQALWDSVSVEDAAVMLAIWALIQDHDHVRKNYYLFHDPYAVDDRWLPIPWDLDLTFGHLWNETDDIFGEEIRVDGDPLTGVEVPAHGFFNRLADDVFRDPEGWLLFHEALATLLDTAFTEDYLFPRIDGWTCQMTPDLVLDSRKRGENDEIDLRAQEIKDFITGRRAFLESWRVSISRPPERP